MQGFFPKQILDQTKGTFPANLEASLYNANGIYIAVKVARNKAQEFKAELPLQMAAQSLLAHMVNMAPEEQLRIRLGHRMMPKTSKFH